MFYQDEADVHLNPKIGATYLKPGHQPLVLTPGKNVKRYIFGALNARTGRIIYGVAENSERGGVRPVPRVPQPPIPTSEASISRLDNYIIHKARCVIGQLEALRERIVLHFLPPYSPDDNVI